MKKQRQRRNGGKYIGSRLTAICLVLCLMTGSLTGCSTAISGDDGQADGKIRVITTIFPYYDFVRQIAGDLVDLSLVVPAGMDTHSFEPTASDMVRIGRADLLIYNGGEMETWVDQVVDASENKALIADGMMDHVETVVEEQVAGMKEEKHSHAEDTDDAQADHAHDTEPAHAEEHAGNPTDMPDASAEYDEHIWTSPVNARKIVSQIAKDLGQADPEHAKTYTQNAENYIKKLQKLDTSFRDIVKQARNHYVVFGDRFPLRYFVEEYGLDYTAAFAGCSSDTEPSADTIAYLTDQVKERKLPVVLKIELTSPKVAQAIAEATNAKVETFYTCHNVTKAQFKDGITYLQLMQKNLHVLKEALA